MQPPVTWPLLVSGTSAIALPSTVEVQSRLTDGGELVSPPRPGTPAK
jgi:hypothetical protein